MPNRPELPTSYQRKTSVYNVLPDDAPMTWGVWDLDGWLGEIILIDGRWCWRHERADPLSRPHGTWEAAADELIRERPDLPLG